MTMTDSLASPRLVALQAALAAGDGAALGRFWAEAEAQGTPLIEPLPGEDAHALVTFLWREEAGADPLRTVVVVSLLTGADLPNHQLQRLPGTDLWHRSYRVPADVRAMYHLAPGNSLLALYGRAGGRWYEHVGAMARQGAIVPDPLNRHPFPETGPPSTSCLVLPDAAPQPWLGARAGVPAWEVAHQRFRSAVLGNERDVWLYTPPGAEPSKTTSSGGGAPAAAGGLRRQAVRRLDGVAHHAGQPDRGGAAAAGGGRLRGQRPPQPGAGGRARPRRLPHGRAAALGPRAGRGDRRPGADGGRRVEPGGLRRGRRRAAPPGRVRQRPGPVRPQCGAFGWKSEGEQERGWGWLLREVDRVPRLPVRFWLDVGRFDTVPLLGSHPGDDGPDGLIASRQMRDVLQAKGCAVRSTEVAGGHDYVWWRGTLADGLLALLGQPDGEPAVAPG